MRLGRIGTTYGWGAGCLVAAALLAAPAGALELPFQAGVSAGSLSTA